MLRIGVGFVRIGFQEEQELSLFEEVPLIHFRFIPIDFYENG